MKPATHKDARPADAASEVLVRPAQEADIDALVDLETRCFSSDRLSRRSFRHAISRGHGVTLVAEVQGRLGGYVMVLFSRGSPMARIYSIAVDPQQRGHGIGRTLAEAAEAASTEAECIELRLEVRPDNPEAIALYESLGFKPFGVLADYYEDHADALRYSKSIAPSISLDMVRVPYYGQTTDFTCGAAALMMAMAAQTEEIRLDRTLELRLWREATTIYMTSGHGGCAPYGLALSAWQRGFEVEVYVNGEGPLLLDSVRNPDKKEVMRLVQEDQLSELRQHGIPLHQRALQPDELEAYFQAGWIPVVLISSFRIYGERFPHWVVVTGFDDRFVYMHDPYLDTEKDETLADCINMPVLRREFAAMARYGRAKLESVIFVGRKMDANHA